MYQGGRINLCSILRGDRLWTSARKLCGGWGIGSLKGGGSRRDWVWCEVRKRRNPTRGGRRIRREKRRE